MKEFSAFLDWGDAKIGLIKSAPKNIQLSEDLFCQFCQSTACLIPDFCPDLPTQHTTAVLKFSSYSSTGFNPRRVDGKQPRQVPIWSWQVYHPPLQTGFVPTRLFCCSNQKPEVCFGRDPLSPPSSKQLLHIWSLTLLSIPVSYHLSPDCNFLLSGLLANGPYMGLVQKIRIFLST